MLTVRCFVFLLLFNLKTVWNYTGGGKGVPTKKNPTYSEGYNCDPRCLNARFNGENMSFPVSQSTLRKHSCYTHWNWIRRIHANLQRATMVVFEIEVCTQIERFQHWEIDTSSNWIAIVYRKTKWYGGMSSQSIAFLTPKGCIASRDWQLLWSAVSVSSCFPYHHIHTRRLRSRVISSTFELCCFFQLKMRKRCANVSFSAHMLSSPQKLTKVIEYRLFERWICFWKTIVRSLFSESGSLCDEHRAFL